jgi:hypothetical protein
MMEVGDECPNCHCGTLEETAEELVCRGECGEVWPKDCVASFSDLVGLHILEQKIAPGVNININAGTGNEESK